MGGSAHVTSIDALKDLKVALAQFRSLASDALCEAELEARRTIDSLQHNWKLHWQQELRQRQEEVVQAKAALARKRLSRIGDHPPDLTEEQKALRRAQLCVQEAETKLENVRRWDRQFPREFQEYQGRAQQLATLLTGTPFPAEAALDRILASLEAYLAVQPAADGGQSATAIRAADGNNAEDVASTERPPAEDDSSRLPVDPSFDDEWLGQADAASIPNGRDSSPEAAGS